MLVLPVGTTATATRKTAARQTLALRSVTVGCAIVPAHLPTRQQRAFRECVPLGLVRRAGMTATATCRTVARRTSAQPPVTAACALRCVLVIPTLSRFATRVSVGTLALGVTQTATAVR